MLCFSSTLFDNGENLSVQNIGILDEYDEDEYMKNEKETTLSQ